MVRIEYFNNTEYYILGLMEVSVNGKEKVW